LSLADYDKGWKTWGDMIDLSPAPFHRRRIILKTALSLDIGSVVDIGCGNGTLLSEFRKRSSFDLVGIDCSELIVSHNKKQFPKTRFYALDISRSALDEKFDLVICSEVLEHIDVFGAALANLRQMCRHYMIITVPGGRVFPIDRKMGHVRHYSPQDIQVHLKRLGFKVLWLREWGFPFHTFYKVLINLRPEAALGRFAEQRYGRMERLISSLLRGLFYLNLDRWGLQILCLAQIEGT
jgi:SAM-dependent methyltransferase